MKNKIHLLLFLLFFGITGNSAFAQKNSWTTGFDWGTMGTVCQKGNVIDTYIGRIELPVYFELTLSYAFTSHLSITTGIANMGAEAGFTRKNVPYELKLNKTFSSSDFHFYEYSFIDVPIKLNYSIPLGKSRFYFRGNAGLIIEVVNAKEPWCTPRPEHDDGSWMQSDSWVFGTLYGLSDKYAVCTSVRGFMYHKVNFLINTGIEFGYRFKSGVGLSLSGDYNTGTRIMGELNIKNRLTYNDDDYTATLKEYVDRLYFKGDYWKVSLGISYTFKKKEKKHAE